MITIDKVELMVCLRGHMDYCHREEDSLSLNNIIIQARPLIQNSRQRKNTMSMTQSLKRKQEQAEANGEKGENERENRVNVKTSAGADGSARALPRTPPGSSP